MPSTSEVEDLRTALVSLNTLAAQDLTRIWRGVESLDNPLAIRDVLLVATPEISTVYTTAAAELTAQWYDEQLPDSALRAAPAPPPPTRQVESTVRWAVSPLFGDGATSPLVLLAGSVQRMVFDASRDTIVSNADAEPGARWTRHASANACAFCRMLTSRTDYTSAEAAGEGHRYHDNCHCMAVPIRAGERYEPPSYVEKWQREYVEAVKATDGSTKAVLNHMRNNAL